MRFVRIIFSVLICFAVLLSVVAVPISAASGSTRVTRREFEECSVNEDLESTVELAALKAEYTENPSAHPTPELIYVMEFGYCSSDMSEYGLYLYVYDPESDLLESLQVQTSFGESTNTMYTVWNCTLISKEGNFSKWRVDINDTTGLDSARRVYKISGITINRTDGFVKEYPVGEKFVFVGNMAGYGSNVNTLALERKEQEVIELGTDFTYYRTAGSSKGLYWQNQINTVYFSVPNKYLTDYGVLTAIHHAYKEYTTKPMVVTNHNGLWSYLEGLYLLNCSAEYSEGQYGIAYLEEHFIPGGYMYYKTFFDFNYSSDLYTTSDSPFDREYLKLPYFFYKSDLANLIENEVAVTTEQIFEFMNKYSNNYLGSEYELVDEAQRLYPDDSGLVPDWIKYVWGYYSTWFEDLLDDYNGTIDFRDPSNIKTLLSYEATHEKWYEKVEDFGLWKVITGQDYIKGDETISNLHPLATIKEADLNLTNKDFSKEYYVAEADVPAIKAAYNASIASDSTLFLFRFDISDYYARDAKVYVYNQFNNPKEQDGRVVVCQQSYYKDFDIISLTFTMEYKDTVIPVSHTPKDFIGDITTPSYNPKDEPPWGALVGLLLLIVLLIVFRKPFAAIVGGICSAVVKVFGGLFRWAFKKE